MQSVTLIIDKRREIPAKYKKLLTNSANSVTVVQNLISAMKFIQDKEPDLIIISDSVEGDLSEYCKKIRALTYNLRPIIIATSKSAELQDKLDVLENGADDFISEPVNSEEFVMRIKAHLRRELESNINRKNFLPNKNNCMRALKRIISEKFHWAVMLVSIENFDNYKETYTELASDKLLQTYCAIIRSVLSENDYIGSLSDNRFLIITDNLKAEKIANYLVFAFDTVISKFYNKNDKERGFIFMHGDDEAEDKVNLVSTSIGVITNQYKKYTDMKQVISSLISTHKLAQYKKGSNYVIERPQIMADNAVQNKEPNNKILIAEPDEALSILLEAAARLQGYIVKVINEFDEIFEAVEIYNPAVIILDAGNSETLKGLEVCRKLKFENQNLKSNIIFTTTVHDKELVLNAGADLYLPKPYELSVMFGWIKKFDENYNS